VGWLSPPNPWSWIIFFSKLNQHMALSIYRDTQLSWNLLLSFSSGVPKRLNPLKCAYFDRLQTAVMLIKGLLSKYAKLIILTNLALNKRTHGPDLPQCCLNWTKSGKLILRKIIKIVATRCRILKLKCTKFDFGWGSAQTPLGELTALAQIP